MSVPDEASIGGRRGLGRVAEEPLVLARREKRGRRLEACAGSIAAPAVVFGVVADAGANRIEDDVAGRLAQMFAGLDPALAEPVLEEVRMASPPPVGPPRKPAVERLHAGRELAGRHLEDE